MLKNSQQPSGAKEREGDREIEVRGGRGLRGEAC